MEIRILSTAKCQEMIGVLVTTKSTCKYLVILTKAMKILIIVSSRVSIDPTGKDYF